MRIALVIAILAAHGTFAPAIAQQKKPDAPPQRVIPNDPTINRPPPRPPERPSVAPASGPAQPMQRIPQTPPLAQPPAR